MVRKCCKLLLLGPGSVPNLYMPRILPLLLLTIGALLGLGIVFTIFYVISPEYYLLVPGAAFISVLALSLTSGRR
jgi:hypothetical protein